MDKSPLCRECNQRSYLFTLAITFEYEREPGFPFCDSRDPRLDREERLPYIRRQPPE